jgi:hypothetical protein
LIDGLLILGDVEGLAAFFVNLEFALTKRATTERRLLIQGERRFSLALPFSKWPWLLGEVEVGRQHLAAVRNSV